jgi:hypothetical protein
MPLSSQNILSTDWTDALPSVQLEVRQGNARSATFALDAVDFLIGTVPGCDLRVAGEGAAVFCLFAKHPGGVSLRKLSPTQGIVVNGESVGQRELADGDRVQLGQIDILCRIAPGRAAPPASDETLERGKREF